MSDLTPVNRAGWWTRDHVLVLVLAVATALLLFLCWHIIRPFVSPLAWALALAIVAHPLHSWIVRRIDKPAVAAALAVSIVAVVIIVPVVFVTHSIVREAGGAVQAIQAGLESGQWREQIGRDARFGPVLARLEQQGNLGGQIHALAGEVGKRVRQFVAGSAVAAVQLLLTLFVLFYLFRDRKEALGVIRSLVPLSEREVDRVFARVSDTIHAITCFTEFSLGIGCVCTRFPSSSRLLEAWRCLARRD